MEVAEKQANQKCQISLTAGSDAYLAYRFVWSINVSKILKLIADI